MKSDCTSDKLVVLVKHDNNSPSTDNDEYAFDEISFNYSTQNDLSKGSPLDKLNIVIDGNQIVRFSC